MLPMIDHENEMEGLVNAYKKISLSIHDLEEKKKALSEKIMERMHERTIRVAHFSVRKIRRLSIKLSLDEARTLNATKVEEIVDKDKIKDLFQRGESIQGVTEIQYLQITASKKQCISF